MEKQPHWRLNSLQQTTFDNAKNALKDKPEYLALVEKNLADLRNGYSKEIDIRGHLYTGEMFYSDIHYAIKGSKKTSTDLQKKRLNYVEDIVTYTLRLEGFYFHS
jgi:hypothetical protein